MAFLVRFTKHEDYPFEFWDGVYPVKTKVKAIKSTGGCDIVTEHVFDDNFTCVDIANGFYINASSAYVDENGKVTFSR